MTPDIITDWLEHPAILPDQATIDAATREWPWFTPTRLMEAMRNHQRTPFDEKVLSSLQIYADNWLPAYLVLTRPDRKEAEIINTESTEDFWIQDEALETVEDENEHEMMEAAATPDQPEQQIQEGIIQPLYTEDYFRHQGIEVAQELPDEPAKPKTEETPEPAQPQTLMVVMSFSEWLNHFKTKSQKEEQEAREKSALRSMWQQEKLAAALEDEPEEIPEDVFEMAVSSITREDDLVSEPLAQIYERQEKWGAAAEMYRKLALKYPSKSAYFASRAEAAKKRLI